MQLAGFENSALGSVWVPDKFSDDQIGALPGIVCYREANELVLDTLDGWVHLYAEQEQGEPDTLDGFFSKIFRPIRKVFKKIRSIPKRIHKEVMRSVRKANERRKKITKSVLKNKYTRQLVRVAGVAFAPFTGGLSLAAAEAAARYGKARYVQGMKRSSAFKRGAVGAVIGYAGGRAVSAGYSAFQKGGVQALNPFSGKAATTATTKVGGAVTTTGGTTVATGTTAAGSSGGLWGSVAKGALKVGAKLAPTIASQMLTARGAAPGGGGVEYVDMPYTDPYGYGPETMPGYSDYGYADAGYDNAFLPGGGTVIPDGVYDEEGNLIDPNLMPTSNFGPLAIVAVGAIAGVVLLRRKKRGKK